MRVEGVEGDIPRERDPTQPLYLLSFMPPSTVAPQSLPTPRAWTARHPRDSADNGTHVWRGGGHGAGRKHCARTRMLEATKQNTHTPSWLDATAGEGLRLGQKKSLKGGQGCVIRLHLSSVPVKQVTSCRYAAGDDVTGRDDVSTPLLLLLFLFFNRLQDDGESLG